MGHATGTMTGLERIRHDRSKGRLYWDFVGLFRALAGKSTRVGRCPACKQINALFNVSTGDDEAEICWPCWKV